MESAYYVDTGLLSPDATGIQIMSIFGSSTVTSSSSSRNGARSSAAAAAKASAAAAEAAAPPFPTFLLPALPLQLFRRRQKRQQQQQQLSPSSSSSVAHNNNSNDNSRSDEDYEEDSNSDDEGATPSLSSSVDSAPSETSGGGVDAAQQHQGLQRRRPRRRLAPPTPATLRCGICATDLAFASQIVSKGFTGRHGRAFLVAPASPNNVPAAAVGRLLPSQPSATAGDGELVNIKIGRSENRQLVTGSHVVADISCRVCGTKVGWKYVDARESQQKYKVGKFILETARVVAWRGWDAGRLPTATGDSDDDDDDDYDNDDGEYAWSSADTCGAQSTRPSTATTSGQKGEAEADGGGGDDDDDDEGPVVFDSDDDDECEDIFAGTWNAETVARRRKMRRALAGRGV